jgi:nickel transport protein
VSRVAARLGALALGLAVAAPAAGHETLHELRRGQAIAVKASFADGEVLAYTPFEVYSPADPKLPWMKGRTDRAGWLAFLPDQPGKWRVKVVESTGHGLDLEVDASPAAGEASGAPVAGSLAFILRPLLGLAVIALVFVALILARRKQGRRP